MSPSAGRDHGPRAEAIRRVLVVEDDPSISTMLVALLDAEGYRAELAVDGGLALEALRERRPDVVTLDLSLPTVDGLEILDRLSEDGVDLPIVVVSAYTERLAERHRRRVAAVVAKPFEIEQLLSSISTALGRPG